MREGDADLVGAAAGAKAGGGLESRKKENSLDVTSTRHSFNVRDCLPKPLRTLYLRAGGAGLELGGLELAVF